MVILNRAPTFEPTALMAFHPVRVPGHAMHFHPLLCKWLNGDFDGDQAAIYLPITEAGQKGGRGTSLGRGTPGA